MYIDNYRKRLLMFEFNEAFFLIWLLNNFYLDFYSSSDFLFFQHGAGFYVIFAQSSVKIVCIKCLCSVIYENLLSDWDKDTKWVVTVKPSEAYPSRLH